MVPHKVSWIDIMQCFFRGKLQMSFSNMSCASEITANGMEGEKEQTGIEQESRKYSLNRSCGGNITLF